MTDKNHSFEPQPKSNSTSESSLTYDWQSEGMFYFSLGFYLKRRFGLSVRKACVDARLGCPNRDGRVSTGGCIFCEPAAFCPTRRDGEPENDDLQAIGTITRQIDTTISALRPADRDRAGVLAYFQPGTNTYGPLDRLESLFREAIAHPRVVGLAVGTRPDCIDAQVVEMLQRVARDTWLSVELGVQSLDDDQLQWMNRGHDAQVSFDALRLCRQAGLRTCAHIILGLPGDTVMSAARTATALGQAGIASIKIHNLHVVRNTRLAELYHKGELPLPTRDEYVDMVVALLEHLPPDCIIERLVGDAPPEYLISPQWCRAKGEVRNAIVKRFQSRGSRQGAKWKD